MGKISLELGLEQQVGAGWGALEQEDTQKATGLFLHLWLGFAIPSSE